MLLADESAITSFHLYSMIAPGSIAGNAKLFVLSFTPLTFTTVFSTTSSFVNSTIEPSGLMVLAATFSENLDANVMRQHQIVLAAIINPNVPENSFGIGIRIHHRLLQSQFRGLHRTPVFAARCGIKPAGTSGRKNQHPDGCE